MRKFQDVTGIAIPWLMPNVDTDIITPMKRLLRNRDEWIKYSFEAYRFVDGDGDRGELNPAFPLNQERYKGAKIMIVGENFGAGSSRETAPIAIAAEGIQCLIGSSFGGIFFKNCFQQSILPIELPKEMVEKLAEQAQNGGEFEVDLEQEELICPDDRRIAFSVDAFRKQSLLQGLDDVGMTLTKKDSILEFFAADRQTRPWVYIIS